MEKLMPIEPGCKCLFTGDAGASAQEVVAVKKVGSIMVYWMGMRWRTTEDTWELDRNIGYADPQPYCREANLLRIDGNPDQSTSKEEGKPVEIFSY